MSLQSELETGHHSERHDLTAPSPETDWQLSVRENGKAASQVGEGF
jgi:hypothetical protein